MQARNWKITHLSPSQLLTNFKNVTFPTQKYKSLRNKPMNI